MLPVLRQKEKSPQNSTEMTTTASSTAPKDTESIKGHTSQESLEPHTSVSADADPKVDHGEDANPPNTTGEPATEQVDRSHLVASEDYSVFTVGQKRAIIFAGSFAAWFSPMVSLTPSAIANGQRLIFQ